MTIKVKCDILTLHARWEEKYTMINFYKKKQNLILGLLVALFLCLILAQTVSVSNIHPDMIIKDFSVMRTVSVPTQADVRSCLSLFKGEIGDAYSFDHLYNSVYAIFVFGIVALFMCFKKFNQGLISKLVVFAYSVLSLVLITASKNLHYILSTYDTIYVVKIIVAALIAVLSLISIIMIIKDLSKNSWLKFVNVHIFLNSICSGIMLITTALMFVPFEFEGKTASIMGYMLLPVNYKSTFGPVFERFVTDFSINSIVTIPVLLFVIAIFGSIICSGYHKNAAPTLLAMAWAVICIIGCIINPLVVLDSKVIIYIILAVGVLAAGVANLIHLKKANEIYK